MHVSRVWINKLHPTTFSGIWLLIHDLDTASLQSINKYLNSNAHQRKLACKLIHGLETCVCHRRSQKRCILLRRPSRYKSAILYLISTGITIIKIRQPHSHLILIMGIPIFRKSVFILWQVPDEYFMSICYNVFQCTNHVIVKPIA